MLDRPPRSEERPYKPYGSALQLWFDGSPEIVVSGPANTGKSRGCMEKMHFCAEHYPGMRGLILRKTRESLIESALVTWEQHVIPAGHPCLRGPARANRRSYKYPNGSEVIVGGLRASGKDMTQRIMSTEYDLAYVQEAIELTLEDWEKITTRLRNGKMPVQQLIADTNPDSPVHWLKQRHIAGQLVMLESRHEENPTIWDRVAGTWTEKGIGDISKLDALTGPRKERLRYGKWVQAEGVVYEGWDRAVHVIDLPKGPSTEWSRWWAIDFGYNDPFVWQEWLKDKDGRLILYREIYETKGLVEDHCRHIKEVTGWGTKQFVRPQAVICDHDAEGRATFERHIGISTTPAQKAKMCVGNPGIQAVQARLRKQPDSKPRLMVCRNALVRRDPVLLEAKRPTCTEQEFDCYIWLVKTDGTKDQPLDKDNHGLDAARYLCSYFDLKVPTTIVPKAIPMHQPHMGMTAWMKR